MARPKTVSDEDVLKAARHVIARRGYSGFTLAEVAAELGLSRTAIILRFRSTKNLKARLTFETVESFRQEMDAVPVSKSGDGLIELAAAIGQSTPSRADIATLMLVSQGNLEDEELVLLEHERGNILRNAISMRMPKTALPHQAAVNAFMAHLAGTIMQWGTEQKVSPKDFLIRRTKEWLILAHIQFRAEADT